MWTDEQSEEGTSVAKDEVCWRVGNALLFATFVYASPFDINKENGGRYTHQDWQPCKQASEYACEWATLLNWSHRFSPAFLFIQSNRDRYVHGILNRTNREQREERRIQFFFLFSFLSSPKKSIISSWWPCFGEVSISLTSRSNQSENNGRWRM